MAINVEEYYRRYSPMVFRRCRSILRDEDAALDAMQDVFIRVMEYRGKLEDRAPSSLLYTIATNVCLNRLRSTKRRPTETGDDEVIDRIAGIDDPESRALNNHFLDRLFQREKSDTRTIAVCHYVDGMTLEETAAVSGLSVSGVRKRLRTLRQRGLALKEA